MLDKVIMSCNSYLSENPAIRKWHPYFIWEAQTLTTRYRWSVWIWIDSTMSLVDKKRSQMCCNIIFTFGFDLRKTSSINLRVFLLEQSQLLLLKDSPKEQCFSLNIVRNCHGRFWAWVSCGLALQEARFRMRITLGVVLIRSLVCAIRVPGRFRSGSRVVLD